MLSDTLKDKLKQAMLSKNEVQKNVLRVILGEAAQLHTTGVIADDAILRTIRKIIENNHETCEKLKSIDRGDETVVLEQEIAFLKEFLPVNLTVEQVGIELIEIKDSILACNSLGMAIGLAMKHLKNKKLIVDGKVVSKYVEEMKK